MYSDFQESESENRQVVHVTVQEETLSHQNTYNTKQLRVFLPLPWSGKKQSLPMVILKGKMYERKEKLH